MVLVGSPALRHLNYYEDGFYYLKIAQQMAAGAGSTFDGVTRTDGYHPLWLLTLIPLFWLNPDPGVAQLGAIGIQVLLLAGAAVLAFRIGRIALPPLAAVLGAILWVNFVRVPALGGMEYGLQAFLILAIILLYARRCAVASVPSAVWHLGFGCLLALAFLARLENAALAAIVILALTWRAWREHSSGSRPVPLLAMGVPVVVAIIGYVVLKLYWFGHPGPVSAAHKRAWSDWLLAQDYYYRTGGWLLAKLHSLVWTFWRSETVAMRIPVWIGSVGAATVWLLGRHARTEPLASTRRSGAPFIAFGALQLMAYTAVYHGALSFPHWYYVIQPFLAAWMAAAAFDGAVRWMRRSPRGGLLIGQRVAVVLLLIAWLAIPLVTLEAFIRAWAPNSRPDQIIEKLHDAGRWLRANTTPSARVGAWNAGTIGYVSRRAVINLDGLVNSWDFYETERFDLCSYWDKLDITYLADAFDGQQVLWTPFPPYRLDPRCLDRLELVWSEPLGFPGTDVRVYRIRAAGG